MIVFGCKGAKAGDFAQLGQQLIIGSWLF